MHKKPYFSIFLVPIVLCSFAELRFLKLVNFSILDWPVDY